MLVRSAGSVAGAGVPLAEPPLPLVEPEPEPVPLPEPELEPLPEPEPDDEPLPLAPVGAPVVPPVVGAAAPSGTAAHPVPGLTPVRTFDQTIVLSPKDLLVPSSNS